MDTKQYINKLFTDAGWYEGRKFKVKTLASNSSSAAYKNAVNLLTEFGGLNVGEVGPGREQSASDICFKADALDFRSELHNYWEILNTSLFTVASAHHDHMLLLVDDSNDFYIFTDPDEQLYLVGSFEETVKRVLLGLNYGMPIEKA